MGKLHRSNGFALVISMLLMGMMVLLIMSVSMLTRVSAGLSSNQNEEVAARQNALLALNLAIGQLQKYAGPDQRTTARSDIDETLADTTTANGRWLGVYGNGAPINYAEIPSSLPATIQEQSDAKGSQAKLLNWLVSGNESVAFLPENDVDADGHILNAPNSFNFRPTDAVDLVAATTVPIEGGTQVLLVGDGSVEAESDRVMAPLVDVFGDDANVRTGRYAWWIGDEGAKANVTMEIAESTRLQGAFFTAQRTAPELVDRLRVIDFDESFLLGDNFAPDSEALSVLNSLDELTFLAAQDAEEMTQAIRSNRHDLTVYSESLLVDTYAGGLKQDLSALLATGATSPGNFEYLFPPDIDNLSDTFGVPTWGALRSYAQTTVPTDNKIDPRVPTLIDVGVSPVMTYYSLGLSYVAPDGIGEGLPIRVAMFPLVVLWNPYTSTIKAHEYEVGFSRIFTTAANYQLQVEKEVSDGAGGSSLEWVEKETVNFNRGATLENDQGTQNVYVRFKIDSPDIPPGASMIFTLQDAESGAYYDADILDEPQNTLTNGLNAAGHVLLDFGADTARFEADEVDSNFRVSGAKVLPPSGSSFGMSSGEISVYLGDLSEQSPVGYISSDVNDMGWYQSISRVWPAQDSSSNTIESIDSSGTSRGMRNEFLQTEGPLSQYVLGPTSVRYFEMNFAAGPQSSSVYRDVRWIAQGNPRALYATRVVNGGSAPQGFVAGSGMESQWITFNAETSGERASAGYGLDSVLGVVDATLFEHRSEDLPLMSIGQLQHANLSLINNYPSYPIGNSLADFHFLDARGELRLDHSNTQIEPTRSISAYYDISWLLNRQLWDRFFVSTIPNQGTGISTDTSMTALPDVLPNARMKITGELAEEEYRDGSLTASGLTLRGGFNINSTSEQAWRAVLGGMNQLPYNPEDGVSSPNTLMSALPRFSQPTEAPSVDPTGAWAWQGFRQLTEEQIAGLAKNIVAEVRNRGPFVSLADFVNRRLVDNSETDSDERFKGVLQAAIDSVYSGSSAVNRGEDTAYGPTGSNPFYHEDSKLPNYGGSNFDLELMQGYQGVPDGEVPHGSTSAFAPQFLTQADVLSAIGSGLAARSDTFVIRAYGESINPLTNERKAQAWCEAVLQRQIEYLDSDANDPNDVLADLSLENFKFGRKFKIVSFRWLTPNEI